MDSSPDWVVIVIAALLNMGIGFVWYSKWLFGPTWMKLAEVKGKKAKTDKLAIFWGFVVALVIAYFLELFARNLAITTVSDGMFLGFCAWLGFVATTQISCVIWHRKPWQLFAINTGCKLLTFLVMGGVIGS